MKTKPRRISEAQIRSLENKCARAQAAFDRASKLAAKANVALVDLQVALSKLKPKESLKRLPDDGEDNRERGDA